MIYSSRGAVNANPRSSGSLLRSPTGSIDIDVFSIIIYQAMLLEVRYSIEGVGLYYRMEILTFGFSDQEHGNQLAHRLAYFTPCDQ